MARKPDKRTYLYGDDWVSRFGYGGSASLEDEEEADEETRYGQDEDASKYRRSAYGNSYSEGAGSPKNAEQRFSRYSEVTRANANRSTFDAKKARNVSKARQAQGGTYSARPDYSASAANYHSRYAGEAPSTVSLSIRGAIVLALVIAIVAGFGVRGGVFSRLSSLNAQVEEAHAELDGLNAENDELQATIDDRQATIDAWEAEEEGGAE